MSVETSRRASSTAIESPTPFSQRVTVPSLTLSPSAGIVIIVPADVAGAAATGTAGAAGGGVTGAAATGAAGGGVTGAAATGAAGAGVEAGAAPSAMIASSAPTGTV